MGLFNFSGVSGNNSSKHRETQLQLQRKLQEREMIREQKRKLEQYGDAEERQAIEIKPAEWTLQQGRVATKLENGISKAPVVTTAQKILLPKSNASSGATNVKTTSAASAAVPTSIAQSQTPVKQLANNTATANLPANNNAQGQSFLVFSPQAHLGQSASVIPQQLLILSPINANSTSQSPVTAIRPQQVGPLSQQTVSKTGSIAPPLLQQVVVNTIPGQPQAMTVTSLAIPNTTASTLLSRSLTQAAPVTPASTLPTLPPTTGIVARSNQILANSKPLERETQIQQNGFGNGAFMPLSGQILKTDNGQLGSLDISNDSQTGHSEDSQGLTVDLDEMRSPSSPSQSNNALLSPTSQLIDANKNQMRQKCQPRTVSSMLKEQRGTHIVSESKGTYVNDNRPVAALLKESRQRQAHGSSGSVISSALSPSTLMIQTVTVSNPSSAIANVSGSLGNNGELSNGVIANSQPILATALLHVNQQPSCTSDNGSPPNLMSPSLSPHNNTVKGIRTRHCSGPEHKAEVARHLQLDVNTKGLKRELQTPDLPQLKRKLLAETSDQYSFQLGSELKEEPKDQVLTMAAALPQNSQTSLAKHILRADSLQDKDMMEYLSSDPAPDLNDITPSIDQMVNSQDEDSLGETGQQTVVCQAASQRVSNLLVAGLGGAIPVTQKNVAVTNPSAVLLNVNNNHPQVFNTNNLQSLNLSEMQQQAFLRGDVLLSQAAKPFPDLSNRTRHRSAGAAVKPSQLLHDALTKPNINNSSIRRLLSSTNDNANQLVQSGSVQTGQLLMSNTLSRMARRAQSVGSASVVQQQQQILGGSMPASPMMSPASNHESLPSANSTPVPSPGPVNLTNKQDLEQPAAAFMPIQTSQQGIPSSFALVRPSFTLAQSPQTQVLTSIPGHLQNQVIQLGNSSTYNAVSQGVTLLTTVQGPILQTAAGNVTNVVSSPATGKKPISTPSNPTIRAKLAQKLKDTGMRNAAQSNDGDNFVSASSIKPVKRGQKTGQKTNNSKRQRHHSAQSALQSSSGTASSAGLAGNFATQLNQGGLLALNQHSSLRQLLNSHTTQDIQTNPSMAGSEHTNGSMSLGPSTPESPFSPEMQDIFGSNLSSQPTMASTSFRSQSVPVSETFYTGSDNQDLFHNNTAMMLEQRDSSSDYLDAGTSDISSLLQDRMHDDHDTVSKADMFSARRNLTELLDSPAQPGGAMLGSASFSNKSLQNYSFMCRGDMMLTSLSLSEHGLMDGINGHSSAPTPPASKNPTPDYSHELSGLQVSSSGLGNMQGTSNLDTPSSLDTLSTHSRESLSDPLLQIYDNSADMPGEVGSQDIDMITPDYFSQWDMPQMVHD